MKPNEVPCLPAELQLRDLFAMMVAHAVTHAVIHTDHDYAHPETTAEYAYQVADAMMAQREREVPHG